MWPRRVAKAAGHRSGVQSAEEQSKPTDGLGRREGHRCVTGAALAFSELAKVVGVRPIVLRSGSGGASGLLEALWLFLASEPGSGGGGGGSSGCTSISGSLCPGYVFASFSHSCKSRLFTDSPLHPVSPRLIFRG